MIRMEKYSAKEALSSGAVNFLLALEMSSENVSSGRLDLRTSVLLRGPAGERGHSRKKFGALCAESCVGDSI
jgi:hypothetical protein